MHALDRDVVGFFESVGKTLRFPKVSQHPACMDHAILPVSSIDIWSENLVAESEAKDGGN